MVLPFDHQKAALRDLLVKKLQGEAEKFSDAHLENLVGKGYTDERDLQDATRQGFESPPPLPPALIDKLLRAFQTEDVPEAVQRQLDAQEARINKLGLEAKEARTERNVAMQTTQKERAIGQDLYDAAKPIPDLLDQVGLAPVSGEVLSAARASIAGFCQQLRNVDSLANAKTANEVISSKKRSKRKLEPVLESAVQQVQRVSGGQGGEEEEEQEEGASLSTSTRVEAVVQQLAGKTGQGAMTRAATWRAAAALTKPSPKPDPSTLVPAPPLPQGTSLADVVLVPAGEKLDEAAHMQPVTFAILERIAAAVGSILHLADTHAKDGFAHPAGFIDCSCLASYLRAWTQLVVAIEFKLVPADMVAALGQLVGRFRNTVEEQPHRTFMLGLGITLQSVEVFYFEMKEESELHVKRTGPLPADLSSSGSVGLQAIARVLAADLMTLGYAVPLIPPTMAFRSEASGQPVQASVQHLLKVGTVAVHRASRVYLAELPDARSAVIKENASSREVDILRMVVPPHPRIVRLEGVAVDGGTTRVLLTPLARLLTWHSETSLVIQVAFDVVCALDYLKVKKVVHRDVSPFNYGEEESRGVLFDLSAAKEVSALPSPSDELENITWTPVAASLGLLEGEKAAATDDVEALFLSLYYTAVGGRILGKSAYSSRNASEMAAARRGSMFVRVLPGLEHVKEPALACFLTALFRIFFPAGPDGRTARYRRDVEAGELKSVCKSHYPGLLED